MILVGKDGAQSSDVTGFFLVVVAPPLTAFAGVGLALRWRWAWYYLVAGLLGIIFFNAVEIVKHPEPSETTTMSPAGVKTTTFHSGPEYPLTVVVFAAGLLTLLLVPRYHREFASLRL